ncbi:hypothetical protein PRIPAC_84797, partial [Pristionchus pacificus]
FRMAGASSFVLRWEIDNARARSATGRMESEVFDEGGFEWTINAEKYIHSGVTKFTLSCDMDRNRSWRCEAEVDMYLLYTNNECYTSSIKKRVYFDEKVGNFVHTHDGIRWDYFINPNFNRDDKVTIEFVINIISSDRGKPIFDSIQFDTPNNRSDVILVIGDKRLHVSKEYLSINSPVFEAMFFGDFIEKENNEVEIKDVIYEEFVDLLCMIYPGPFKITDATVVHLLVLSDRFQIKHIRYPAEAHLRNSKKFTTAQKLAVAEKYNLNRLRDYCIHTYTASQSIVELESTPEYASFSFEMKAAICDRVMQLLKEKK